MLEFAHLLSLLTSVHGIIFGAVLFFISSKHKPTSYLGVFLFTWGMSFIPNILMDQGVVFEYPFLIFIPIRFYFLSIPLLYLYVRKIIFGQTVWENRKHLIPACIELIVFFLLWVLVPGEKKLELINSPYYIYVDLIYHFVVNVFVVYYLILIFKVLLRNKDLVNGFYSNVGGKLLNWVKSLSLGFLLLVLINSSVIVLYFFTIKLNFEIPLKTSIIIFVVEYLFIWMIMYWALVFGYRQYVIRIPNNMIGEDDGAVFIKEQIKIESESLSSITKDQPVSEEDVLELNNIFRRLNTLIEETKCFTNPDLSIADLAKMLDVHHRKLSKVINYRASCNFNMFINKFRVEEAKLIMSDPERTRFITLEVVGQEVGFKSRSSIYTAFKKIEGKTPASFIMKV